MSHLRLRRRVAVAALSTSTVLGLALAGSAAAHADAAGKLFISPSTGTQDTYLPVTTSGTCPSQTRAVLVTLTGQNVADDGNNNLLGNTDYALVDHSGGKEKVTANATMKDVFSAEGVTPQQGDYQVTLVCQDTRGANVYATFAGTVTVTPSGGTNLTYSQASQATATTTTLAVDPAQPVASGTQTTMTATVSPAAAGSVQFKRDDVAVGAPVRVSGGTASLTLALPQGQYDLRAVFTPDDANTYAASTSSAVAYTVVDAPTVTGTPAVDATLTCNTGQAGTPAFAWIVDGQVDPSVTTASVAVPAAWLGRKVACRVTTTVGSRSVTQTSDAVTVAQGAKLKATTAPSVAGKARVGSKLTCRPGAWTPSATSYAYQWLRDGKAIARATASSYKEIGRAHV